MSTTEQLEQKYSSDVIESVRQQLGLEDDDASKDARILNMSKNEIFKHVVNWDGLMGNYDVTIKNWILDVYGVDLDDVE